MTNWLLGRFSLSIKVFLLWMIALTVLWGSSWLIVSKVQSFMMVTYDLQISFQEVLFEEILRVLIIATIVLILSFFMVYRNILFYIRSLNNTLSQTLNKKRFLTNFESFSTRDDFAKLSTNANALMTLFKSHDQLKSSRVRKELGTVKAVMAMVSEGVILLNEDKIVTHINHHAERLFRLISGEIIGQVISRNITNEVLLSALDRAIKQDVRVLGEDIQLKDGQWIQLSIIPIKNRDLKLTRVVIMISESTEKESPEDPTQEPPS